MSGIVGYVGTEQAAPIILEGLRKVEYRGYDSAGLAVGSREAVQVWHADGKLRNLEASVHLAAVQGTFGIGHTSWDVHRKRSVRRTHRAAAGDETVVALSGRPGNIEELRYRAGLPADCSAAEVLASTISRYRTPHTPLEEALGRATLDVEGRCAIAAIHVGEPGKIAVAQLGIRTVVGLGKRGNFVTTEVPAILNRTRDMIHLEDRDVAVLSPRGVLVLDADARPVYRPVHHVLWDPLMAEKSGYEHLMLKEIFEQPRAIRETLLGRMDGETGRVVLDELGVTARELRSIRHLNAIGSGSSWHAGLVAKAMIEQLARIHVEAEYGSEFRYSNPVLDPNVLSLVISKSGETADTVASQQLLHSRGSQTIAVCNSVDSTIATMARGVIYTRAGPELAAASTKSFTSQLTAMFVFAMLLGQIRGRLSDRESRECVRDLQELPSLVESALELSSLCERLARTIAQAGKVLCVGRGAHFAIALEGARMLQELCSIQADGCAGGELRHGPTALIDQDMAVLVLATVDETHESSRMRYEKTLAQVQEMTSRQGRVICIANEGDDQLDSHAHEVIPVPRTRELLQPAVSLIPLQLLAYHVAVLLGKDVDQPRDFSKSVTAG